MARVPINCHADLHDLENRSDETMVVEVLSLDSVRIASDSCALICSLIQRKSMQLCSVGFSYWACPQMRLLSHMAGVSLELRKIKHDLCPLLLVQEAKLQEGGFLKALLRLKNSAAALVYVAKHAKEIVERCIEWMDDDGVLDKEEDLLFCKEGVLLGQIGKVEKVGQDLKDTADLVLEGIRNIAWLQLSLPSLLEVVDVLLSTPVRFPDPELLIVDM